MYRLIGLLAALAFAFAPAAVVAAQLPRPAHVVIVIEENRTDAEIVGGPYTPYLTSLAKAGARFTHAHGEMHPSLPNYFALFAGLTNTNGDDCPARGVPRDAPNLASELLAAGFTFGAYSESLPAAGFTGCWAGTYGRKHAPWVHFSNVPQQLHRPFSAFPAPAALPTVAFVVPNVDNDMHDGTRQTADDWVRTRLGPLLAGAQANDTLVIFTWDEGYDDTNSIPTFFVGPMVRGGTYAEPMNHYRLLRTLEEMYGLAPTGRAATVAPVLDCWR